MRTDRLVDRRELIVALLTFANAHKTRSKTRVNKYNGITLYNLHKQQITTAVRNPDLTVYCTCQYCTRRQLAGL